LFESTSSEHEIQGSVLPGGQSFGQCSFKVAGEKNRQCGKHNGQSNQCRAEKRKLDDGA